MVKCKTLNVPKDCCYIRFGKGDYQYNDDGWYSVRNEWMIIDLDKERRIIGIELIGNEKATRKPCQEGIKQYRKNFKHGGKAK